MDTVRAERDVAPRLIVELTETAALHHFEENAQFVSQLREVGVRVAIDDFGAGYTSFRNLQLLHVDTVKIDGSYVKNLSDNPENQVFVRTLVGLAGTFSNISGATSQAFTVPQTAVQNVINGSRYRT